MKIWMVNTGCENSCAWTNRNDAILYFKKEVKDCEWVAKLISGKEEDEEEPLVYKVYPSKLCFSSFLSFVVSISPIYLDEKPYF